MDKNLFVIVLRYVVDTKEVDELRTGHIKWLDEHYANGTFLASGRQTPGYGGVIIARASSRQFVLDLLGKDPFHVHKAAEYSVFEFAPTKIAPEFAKVLKA